MTSTKTPEQMAEEYANESGWLHGDYVWVEAHDGFLAGYQAAMNSPKKLDSWISVKDRLPEIGEHGYSKDVLLLSEVGRMEVSHIEKVKRVVKWRGIEPVIETENGTPIEYFTHWMPLPEAPKGEG